VARAIKRGDLTRQSCEVCGAAPQWHGYGNSPSHGFQRVIAHHDDYSKPLDVRWLCRTHHFRFHLANGDYANLGSKSQEMWDRRKQEQAS
jgi:hypothetical protein